MRRKEADQTNKQTNNTSDQDCWSLKNAQHLAVNMCYILWLSRAMRWLDMTEGLDGGGGSGIDYSLKI